MTKTKPPTSLPVAPAVSSPIVATAIQHDAIQQARLLRDALQSDKVRLGCFLGAGCPSGVYDNDGKKCDPPLIPDVARLTSHIRDELVKHAALKVDGENDAAKVEREKFVPCWDTLVTECIEGGVIEPNVEHILSELRTLTARRGKTALVGLEKALLDLLDKKVCDLIVDAVGKSLPSHRCSYHRLASWVGGLQRSAPIDLFTPNYDLLVEEAFEQQQIPHFDGFVGSREPFFDIASIEQDAIPRRWTRLWKLHGSINWQRRDDGTVFRAQGRAAFGKAMIYPSHLKYDQSRRMPYLAMIDRLRAFFRSGGHAQGFGPPVLVVCGYSFSDDHLNEVLLDGLRGNPAAQCFVLAYSALDSSKAVVKFASGQPNLTVLALDGAVVGTRTGHYGKPASAVANQEPWIVNEPVSGSTDTPPAEAVRCRLGDFHFFGLFLEQLYGGRNESEHVALHA